MEAPSCKTFSRTTRTRAGYRMVAAGHLHAAGRLRLRPEFNGITLQASGKGVILQGRPTPGDEFIHGLITIREATSVTIRGIQLAAPQIRISPSERSFSGLHPRNGRLLRDFSRRLHLTTGISVRGSAGLTVDDCTFDLPDPGRVNSFAAGIFTSGAMDDLTIKGCAFRVGRVELLVEEY